MQKLGPDNAVYAGDGEWIAFEDFGDDEGGISFSSTLAELEWEASIRQRFPLGDLTCVTHFLRLYRQVRDYHADTGRHLDVYGMLGELYAAANYGLQLHRAKAQGSDGRLDNGFVEVKTIGPQSSCNKVRVKLSGNFSHLAIVRISPAFEIESRMVPRRAFAKGGTGMAGLSWSRADVLAVRDGA